MRRVISIIQHGKKKKSQLKALFFIQTWNYTTKFHQHRKASSRLWLICCKQIQNSDSHLHYQAGKWRIQWIKYFSFTAALLKNFSGTKKLHQNVYSISNQRLPGLSCLWPHKTKFLKDFHRIYQVLLQKGHWWKYELN